jgi:hypothetical protein
MVAFWDLSVVFVRRIRRQVWQRADILLLLNCQRNLTLAGLLAHNHIVLRMPMRLRDLVPPSSEGVIFVDYGRTERDCNCDGENRSAGADPWRHPVEAKKCG